MGAFNGILMGVYAVVSIGYFKIMTSFSIFRHGKKIHEKFKLIFEYF